MVLRAIMDAPEIDAARWIVPDLIQHTRARVCKSEATDGAPVTVSQW